MEQILQGSYDESNQRLRVETAATIVAGAVEVAINDTTDSIKIGDGTGDYLKVNPDGSIDVNATLNPSPGSIYNVISNFNEVTNIATGIETSVVSYSVPFGKTSYLQYIQVAGTNIAEYKIYKNGTLIDKSYTMFGMSLDTNFDYRNEDDNTPGLLLNSTDNVIIKVINPRPYTGNFNARIQILQSP